MDLSKIMDFQADSPSGWPADRSDPGGLVGAAVPGFIGTNPSCCSGMVPVLESFGSAPFGSVLNTQQQKFDLMQYYSGEEAGSSENSYAVVQNLPVFAPRMMQCLPPVFGNFGEGSGLYNVLEQGMIIHHENDHFLTGVDFNLPHNAVQQQLLQQQQQPGVSNSGMEQDRVCFTLESVSKSMSRHLQLFPEARARAPPLQQVRPTLHQVRPTLHQVRPTLLQLWRSPTICSKADQKEPHSIAARQRRRRISERLRMLEQLVPGGDRLDTASMLEEACRFVKFLQIQARFLQAIPEAGHLFEFAAPPPDDCPFAIAHELQTVLFKHNLCIASIHHCPPDLLFPHPS